MIFQSAETWSTYAQACAFVGNSLLKPMTQTSPVGLDAEFWRSFPDFGSEEVRMAAETCAFFAEGLDGEDSAKAVERVSVEYTRLFVGPPSPAAAPWETMYRSDGSTVGFGEATFEMRRLLREAGLQLCNENNQYEDHMGIELLYLSVLCQRIADALAVEDENAAGVLVAQARGFAAERPTSWIDALAERVEQTFPAGYFSCILRLAKGILGVLVGREQLSRML